MIHAVTSFGGGSSSFGGLFAIAVVAAIAIIGGQLYFNHRRHAQAQEWANARGWSYTKSDRSYTRFSSGSPFGQGHSRSATKILQGPLNGPGGRRTISFTLTWTEGSGDDAKTHYRHVVAVDLGLRVPQIDVRPENALTRRLGRDIQFESDSFNREWRVTSRDERFAHGVIHPRMMELLMTPAHRGRTYRYENRYIMTWHNGRTDLDRIIPTAEHLSRLADQMPNYKYNR